MSAATFEFAPLEPVAPPPRPHAAAPGAPSPAPAEPGVPAAEVERLVRAAHADGYSAGVADARGALDAPAAALRAAAEQLAVAREQTADAAERAAVELALRIADQVLQTALEVRPELVVDAVRGALRRLVERERVIVLVHPDDLDLVREHAPALAAELGGVEHCEVQAERRVTRGGAIVRTGEGEVDATLDSKLERAREVVRDALAG